MSALDNTPAHPPMILPWLARKARISNARALALWQRALADVPADPRRARRQGRRRSARVLDRLRELIAAEGLAQQHPDYRLNTPWRWQVHLGHCWLDHCARVAQLLLRNWQLLFR